MLIKSIITWTFGGDGTPVLNYGQGAGYSGGNDPMNREPEFSEQVVYHQRLAFIPELNSLWFTSYSTDVMYYDFFTTLNQARKLALADKTLSWPTPTRRGHSRSPKQALKLFSNIPDT